MKCHKITCPVCKKPTIVPDCDEDFYYSECVGYLDGFLHCVSCGEQFAVTCELKVDNVMVFKVT